MVMPMAKRIVGAEMMPFVVYLAGFTLIQYAIAMVASGLVALSKASNKLSLIRSLALLFASRCSFFLPVQ